MLAIKQENFIFYKTIKDFSSNLTLYNSKTTRYRRKQIVDLESRYIDK